MIDSNNKPLHSISPTIDYKYFNSNYQRRKKSFLLLKEKELPLLTITSNNKFNSIHNKTKNMFKLPILSPVKTSNTIEKTKTIRPELKNLKFQIRNKIPKKNGKLSIKYLDIINMNKNNKLLLHEITKASIIEEDITQHINDPVEKSKILNELNIINDMTSEEIENLMDTTTKEEKGLALNFLKLNPKMIYLSAEEIFKELKYNKNRKIDLNDKNKEEKFEKNRKVKNNYSTVKDKSGFDFLLVAKNNIKRKIELRNQYNQEISIEDIDILLRNEIEKIKIIIAMYLNEQQNENILFNPDETSSLSENRKEKLNRLKNIRVLDKSIKKFMRLNNCYNDLIRTNYGEEKYRNGKIMINEQTQCNYYEELNNEKNNRYNTEEEYIKNLIKQLSNKKHDKNLINNDEKRNIDYRNKKNIFARFKRFSKNKNNIYEAKSEKFKNNDKNILINNDINNNDNIERRTIHTNKKDDTNDNNHWLEKKGIKLANSKSYKTSIEKGKIISMSNKDILSVFNRTKFKCDKEIKITIKSKEKEKEKEIIDIINSKENQLNKEKNIKIINNAEDNDINDENNINNSEENENSENEKGENYSSSENGDEDENNENFIMSQLTYKNNENNNIENNYNILLSTTEEPNNINSLNMVNGYQTQHINKSVKSPKSNKKKKKGNKGSPGKVKKSQEKSDLNTDQKTNKNRKNILLNNDIVLTNKSQNNRNKIKNQNFFRKSKIITLGKKISSPKRRRKSIFTIEKNKKFLIKDFEVLNKNEKIIKRNKSKDDIPRLENAEMNLKEQVNVIKLHEDDMDQIVNFMNEEEKRRIRMKKNTDKLNKEKRRKTKKDLYNLFKVKEKKEEEKDPEDLTRDDLIEKLKRDDWRIRQYIEDIIRAGLTMGNKELNKRMKNESIIVFQGFNLGKFKFKKNFGIKEEVDLEPFRPLSHDKRIHQEDSETKEKETEKYFYKKEKKEEKNKDKNKEEKKDDKEKIKKKKKEEAKKKLIYDNQYLFKKKRQSVKFILRKEIEEIVQGGIFLQQLAKTEEEKNTELLTRFLPKRSKFIKKKKNRKKLFRKSRFLNDVRNNDDILPIKENNYSSSESIIKEESDNSFEDKMQKLINRVKKLKKGEESNTNEVEKIMNQKNERNKKEKEKEIRKQGFLHTLNEYRDMNKNQRKKNDNFYYKVPIQITANSDGDKITSNNNSKI